MKGINKAQQSLVWMMPQRFLGASSLKILSEKKMRLWPVQGSLAF